MTDLENFPLLERVNNKEFFELLPHLNLERSFLTQVFVPKKKWIHMLDPNFQTLQVKCGGCNRQVKFEEIQKHLLQNDHLISLRINVKQFYHPFYTYGKGDIKLARGEDVSKDVKESVLRELSAQIKSFKKDCMLAKKFVEVVQRRTRELEDNQLLKLSLNASVRKPEEMLLKACLPFKDIPKLVFSVNDGEWQTVVSYQNLTKKANFHCNICGINCSGIRSLNSHFNGYTHKLKQLNVLVLRYESSLKVNKNFCIEFGDSFLFSVKEEAKQLLRDTIESDSVLDFYELSRNITIKVSALDKFLEKTLIRTDNLDLRNTSVALERNGNSEFIKDLGHLGVEYILKIMKNDNDKDPKFECGLCEFVGNAIRMQRHLLNYDHKKKYLDLHYLDTIKRYESALGHMRYMEFRAVMNEIVEKIAIEIEKQHSRSLPYAVSINDYKTRRQDLITEVYALLHASQNRGPSFSNIVSKEELKNLKNRSSELAKKNMNKTINCVVFTIPPITKIYLNQMSHDPVICFREHNEKTRKTYSSRRSRSKSPKHYQIYDPIKECCSHRICIHKHHICLRSPANKDRSRSPKPWQSDSELPTAFYENIWDVYRREIAIAANEIEIAYESYRKNPESHPLYEKEWNDFWQRRKTEIEHEGFNHRAYNFQPEWVRYFEQRIEVLFGKALYKSQINVRRKLEIPLDAEEDCQRLHLTSNHYIEERYQKIKKQFLEDKSESICTNQPNALKVVTNIGDNHSNVVHVLRLITALEEHLGSLGGKIMDLLSISLQLEKNFGENSVEFESKILTAYNCQLLETAVEKLKGIKFAGLLDEKKVPGFNRVIQYTTNLLKYAEKMEWRHDTLTDRNNLHYQDNDVSATKISSEKPLSDTLIDLVKTPETNKNNVEVYGEQCAGSAKHHSMPLACPPPPNIKGLDLNTNLNADKERLNSGLASFNTKLSLDRIKKARQSHQNKFGHLHGYSDKIGNSLNNNSFKNNNNTRTNISTRTNCGTVKRGGLCYNSESAPQFKNSNNTIYQGEGGGIHSHTWSNWNN